ncbi:MAG: bifunctional DNA-formamidopyrimidine glycosylase/DNA-(apurinic or apyrimidinic site) lyase [Candidatus Saccharimonadales bacterium]
MPELPEVETIKRGLEDSLKGQTIKEVEILWSKSMPVDRLDIEKLIIDTKVINIRRRGKVLIIDLSSEYSLLIHLKMTGQVVLDIPKSQDGSRFGGGHPTKSLMAKLPDNSTRVIIDLSRGHRLFFNDQRKFGWIKLIKTKDIDKQQLLRSMGPEPLDKNYTLDSFSSSLRKTSRAIKAAILDQSVIAGVGNIYADESLHMAKIHPLRKANSLSSTEIERLYSAIPLIMETSLNYGGTSFTNYVNANGLKGNYLDNARVFRREGELCDECGGIITKIRVAGRGTHLCSNCQTI